MKKFLTTFTGGEPFNLADIRWFTAGLYENTVAMLSTICPVADVVILSGCDRSVVGSTVTISAGWVTKGGEIYRVAAHSFSIASGGPTEYWTTQTLFDPEGLKSYNSGSSHDTYQEVVYKVIYGAAPGGSTAYNATKKYVDLVTSNLVLDPWQEFKSKTFLPGSIFGAVTMKLYCMRDLNGFVHIQGYFGFEDIGGSQDILIGTLPVGYRPTTKREACLSTQINNVTGEIGSIIVTIDTNGEMRLISAQIGYADTLDFSQIQPFMRAI